MYQNKETHVRSYDILKKKIEPFVVYYKKLIKSYNHMAHNILGNEINLILPQISKKQKCGIITTLVSSFIGLAYEGKSSFYIIKEIKPYTKLSKLWIIKPTFSATS